MRGAGDQLSVGERIAFYRRRRGLTQGTLAALMGRSEDWLSKIERGERQLQKIELAVEMARHLRVTLGDLLGQPVLVEDPQDQPGRTSRQSATRSCRRVASLGCFTGSVTACHPPPDTLGYSPRWSGATSRRASSAPSYKRSPA